MSKVDDRPVWVIGAGGHAKVVIDSLRAIGIDVRGAFDENPALAGSTIMGVPIRAPFDEALLRTFGVSRAVLAVGSNGARKHLAQRFEGLAWATVVHPAAYVASTVSLGPGSVVFAGTLVQPGAVVGAHTILNTGCSVDHDCTVGDYVHVAPGVRIAGEVSLGDGTLMGVGSAVVPRVRVGSWAVVGAGSVVVDDVPDGATVKGVPARGGTHVSHLA